MHIVLIPSSYGMLVYRIVTSTETMIACYGTSMKLMKLMNSLGRGPYELSSPEKGGLLEGGSA